MDLNNLFLNAKIAEMEIRYGSSKLAMQTPQLVFLLHIALRRSYSQYLFDPGPYSSYKGFTLLSAIFFLSTAPYLIKGLVNCLRCKSIIVYDKLKLFGLTPKVSRDCTT